MYRHLTIIVALVSLSLTMAACQRTPSIEEKTRPETAGLSSTEYSDHPREITNSVGMKLVFIPAGTLLMGSPADEVGRQPAEVQHQVTLTRPFYIGTTEVTQKQWLALMDENPSFVEGEAHPVETITWELATEFCNKLSQREGRTYRLPTEAQWEYACRAGTTTPFHTGQTLTTDLANFDGRPAGGLFRDETTAVATFAPNAWGLYDMHGNVWEWCADWHGPYSDGPVTDPAGPPSGETRVVRGGCWVNKAAVCRSASRGDTEPVSFNFHFGFRVVCDPPSNPLSADSAQN